MKQPDTDILIAGGGAPGLTLAILLGRIGLRVTVVDPAPPRKNSNGNDSRTSALMVDSINILQTTGAWDLCRDHGGIMRALKIIDDTRQPPISVTFEASEIGQEIFGVNMPNALLRDALLAAAAKVPAVTIKAPAKLLSYTTDEFGMTATIDGGTTIRARLIVGADGRQSTVRQNAGIAIDDHDYGQQAITCLIHHTIPHQNISTEFHRPSGPFTLVPLPGNQASVVWVDFNDAVDNFLRLNKNSFRQALQDRSNGLLGALEIVTPPQAWPLKRLKARSLTAPRAALIAEAAHVLHPLGAQGLNLSLRDAAALAEIIADAARLGQDIGSAAVLSAYAARRHNDIAVRVMGTETLNRLVSTSSPLSRGLRRLGLQTVGSVSLLKDFAMRQGLAPDQTQSRLARGKGL